MLPAPNHSSAVLQRPQSYESAKQKWSDACLALTMVLLLARQNNHILWASFGGIQIKSGTNPVRTLWLDLLKQHLPAKFKIQNCPPSSSLERMIGGLDLTASINAARPIYEQGILARANGGIVLASGAERLNGEQISTLIGALDQGDITNPSRADLIKEAARFLVIACDETEEQDEQAPQALMSRLGATIMLDGIPFGITENTPDFAQNCDTALPLDTVSLSADMLEALVRKQNLYNDISPRSLVQLCAIARLHAALEQRKDVALLDIMAAERLVYAGLEPNEDVPEEAVQPEPEDSSDNDQDQTPPPPDNDNQEQDSTDDQNMAPDLDDLAIDAAAANLAGLELALLGLTQTHWRAGGQGKSGANKDRAKRGRPIGTTARAPFPGAKPDIAATLRAAAPWQIIRRKQAGSAKDKLHIHMSDFRYKRLRSQSETAAIFAVDASGSTALQRLGEAKGAIELLLADCYVKRHHVAMVAFRGRQAEVVLPPTRALARAKRALGSLPGGGATPLASGIKQALELAIAARHKGQTPLLVILSDGSGNIALDGTPGRPKASEDTDAVARLAALQNIKTVFIDIGKRPGGKGKDLAAKMRADYWPLPVAQAGGLSNIVQSYLDNDR